MDLLDRLLGHDAWTTRQLLLRCQELSNDQLDREFDIAHRTVRARLLHIIRNVEVWSQLMVGRPVVECSGRSVGELIARFNRAVAALAAVAHDVSLRGAWDERFLDTLDNPPVEKTLGVVLQVTGESRAAAATGGEVVDEFVYSLFEIS